MEYRRLGSSNLHVSAICLGTMTFGQQNTEAEAHAQLDHAVAHGINFIDSAEMYPVPPRADTVTRTETIVGNWLKKQPRDQIILGTKVAGPRRNMEWIRGGPKSLDRANIRTAVEGSTDTSSGGAPSSFPRTNAAAVIRAGSISRFSRNHSSL